MGPYPLRIERADGVLLKLVLIVILKILKVLIIQLVFLVGGDLAFALRLAIDTVDELQIHGILFFSSLNGFFQGLGTSLLRLLAWATVGLALRIVLVGVEGSKASLNGLNIVRVEVLIIFIFVVGIFERVVEAHHLQGGPARTFLGGLLRWVNRSHCDAVLLLVSHVGAR